MTRTRPSRGQTVLGTACLLAAAALVALFGSPQAAEAVRCRTVEGRLVERAVTGPACLSPVGLCTAGEYRGDLEATFTFVASAIVPSAATPTTGVVFVTGDSALKTTRGDLILKNPAAFRTIGDGELSDVQVIVGSSGRLAGATGALQVTGAFDGAAGAGEGRYTGRVCLP